MLLKLAQKSHLFLVRLLLYILFILLAFLLGRCFLQLQKPYQLVLFLGLVSHILLNWGSIWTSATDFRLWLLSGQCIFSLGVSFMAPAWSRFWLAWSSEKQDSFFFRWLTTSSSCSSQDSSCFATLYKAGDVGWWLSAFNWRLVMGVLWDRAAQNHVSCPTIPALRNEEGDEVDDIFAIS